MKQFDIKSARESLNLTQEQLGELAGVARQSIVRYERENRGPKSFMVLLALLANHRELLFEAADIAGLEFK